MNRNSGHLVAESQLHGGQQVAVERVHSAVADQPDKVQGTAAPADRPAQLDQGRNGEELARLDTGGNADHVLRHYPAGPQVEVSDFTVTHLTVGKADREAAGVKQGSGRTAPEGMPHRSGAKLDCVAFAGIAVSPPVQHDQGNRCAAGSAV